MKRFLFAERGGFRRDIDSGVFVLAALLLAIFVINSFNFLPLMLPVAAEVYGLNDEQLSQLANWELFSTSIASLFFTLFMLRRVNWRLVGIAACLLQVGCNLASLQAQNFEQLFLLRILSGVGQGLGFSLALVGLNVSLKPGRSFALWICATNIWIGLLFLLLPLLMAGLERGGIDVLYGFYALTAALACGVFLWYPNNGRRDRDVASRVASAGRTYAFRDFALATSLVAGAILIYHMTVGIVYPYLGLMGARRGFAAEHVQYAMTVGTFLAAAVGLLAALTDQRRNDFWSLLLVGVLHALGLWLYAQASSESGYLLGIVAFLAIFNLFTALLFKAMALVDGSGVLASLGPELSSTGIFLGPMLAGALLGPSNLADQVQLAALFTLVALLLVMVGRTLRRPTPVTSQGPAKDSSEEYA
ncbi:MFS transporter [Pseudomonas sp. CrR25]|nr:MFS transporter [Pseudomonas sp. CrR25]